MFTGRFGPGTGEVLFLIRSVGRRQPASVDGAAAASGILTLNNSRVNNNKAGGDGGGIANGLPLGGPMQLPGGPVTLHNSQVTHNSATHGGGIFNFGGTVALSGTAVTANTPDNCEPPNSVAGCTG